MKKNVYLIAIGSFLLFSAEKCQPVNKHSVAAYGNETGEQVVPEEDSVVVADISEDNVGEIRLDSVELTTSHQDGEGGMVADTIASVQVEEGFITPKDNDSFTLISASVDGDILAITVSYSGGCEEHEFELFAGINYAKSLPPQLTLFIKHNGNGDACRALLERTYYFNISEIQYSGAEEVVLRFTDSDITARYTY